MIIYMKSSTFIDGFIQNEDDIDILTASYVCVSMSIRRKSENDLFDIIIANKTSFLYPSNIVFSAETIDDMRELYIEDLEEDCLPFLSVMIKKSIKKGQNFILICSDKEWKLQYLKWMAEFVYDYFGYPVYSYKDFVSIETLADFDEKAVLNKVNKILKHAKRRNLDNMSSKEKNRAYKTMKTSELKKILKDKDLYNKNMSRSDMLDMLDAFS